MNDQWKTMNSSYIDIEGGVSIDTTTEGMGKAGCLQLNILCHAGQLDNFTYDLVKNHEHEPFYGQFYVNNLNKDDTGGYVGILLLNATS